MNKLIRSAVAVLIVIALSLTMSGFVFAIEEDEYLGTLSETADYLINTVSQPQASQIGGEWSVIGMIRSENNQSDDWLYRYCDNLIARVKYTDGILSDRKYTEFSRAILALTAMGIDPSDVVGYNLLEPLNDYSSTISQGLSGAVFALISLDSGNYATDDPDTGTMRDMYIDFLLSRQLEDGGFALSGAVSDPDVTAVVLQAFANYLDRADVKAAADEAIARLSTLQNDTGGFKSYGASTAESAAQVIITLCTYGISLDDPRFVKNGLAVLDNLMTYHVDGGGFNHIEDGTVDIMATEQAFLALTALMRFEKGMTKLYDMSDVAKSDISLTAGTGLLRKQDIVEKKEIVNPGATFEDISNHYARAEIEAMASRGIINGYENRWFRPDNTMTRAEFATLVVRALNLPEVNVDVFEDVTADKWYAKYIGAAYTYGIVNGVSPTSFDPDGTITRQEGATMIARAAKLCGFDTDMAQVSIRNILMQFSDYTQVYDWAEESLAFCYSVGIFNSNAVSIRPRDVAPRCEISLMVYRLLNVSNLL